MTDLAVNILEDIFGDNRKHNETTGQISFDCPACAVDKGLNHGDGKGNLEINYFLNKYKCWACHETNNMHGSLKNLLKKYGTSKNIRDYKLVRPDYDIVTNKVNKIIDLELPEGFTLIIDKNKNNFKFDSAKHYLNKRGITDDIINKFNIGYTTKGKYYNRIIIPSYDEYGELNYFIGRWFDKQKTKLKYLNPEIEKQEIIFNDYYINYDSTIYLVEGVTDHVVVPNSIPMLGKNISDILLNKLQEKANANIVILLDDDAYDDAVILYKKINFGRLLNKVLIIKPPNGYDPSLIHQKLGRDGIIKLLKSARKLKDSELY